jgi:iron(III) transport system substrate-binding protein
MERGSEVAVMNQFVRLAIGLLWVFLPRLTQAAEPDSPWKEQWAKAIRAAEQEGQLVIYTLSEIGDVFLHGGFQKKFPKIKLVVVSVRGGELVSRIMAERRAGKFLADVGNLGNTSPYRLYEAKVLEPIDSSFLLPEVSDPSKWWQGKHHYIDPDNSHILVYVGAPLFLVAYNTNLVNPREFKSYTHLLNPRWKGKIAAFDPRAGGFAATRDRFFYYNTELGPTFLKRLFSEMDLTLYRQFSQGEDWLASGKFPLCLCRHQSISEAKQQGLPVDLMDPTQFKEGVGIETRAKTLVLMNNAPHPNAAKVFINWFLSREGQIDFQKVSGKYIDGGSEGSLRTDIPKDDVAPRNRLQSGVTYIPQWKPEMFDMKPIMKVFNDGMGDRARN